jgi:hypothetical protein
LDSHGEKMAVGYKGPSLGTRFGIGNQSQPVATTDRTKVNGFIGYVVLVSLRFNCLLRETTSSYIFFNETDGWKVVNSTFATCALACASP